jgi:alpha-1,3-glucosyltransferase
LAAEDWNHYQAFVVASVSGIIGLFPLLFKAAGGLSFGHAFGGSLIFAETPVKMGYSFIWLVVVCGSLRASVPKWVVHLPPLNVIPSLLPPPLLHPRYGNR